MVVNLSDGSDHPYPEQREPIKPRTIYVDGGHPTDPKNLWPEPYAGLFGAHQKDQVENYLHKAVCSGEMTLAEAQTAIRTDWVKVYLTHFFKLDHSVTEETKP